MDEQGDVRRRVADVVARFEADVMSIRPTSVSVDLHANTAVVTMRGATPPAEKDYAREKSARMLLERFYVDLFDTVKGELTALVEAALGRKVRRCRLDLDPESGDGVILITFVERPGEDVDRQREGRSHA